MAELAAQGIDLPFPIQEATIRDALDGRDVCGKAATGSGKTLAFGLPLLQRAPGNAVPHAPQALVLVPTRELARQVLDVLRPLGKAVGIRVAQFYGGTSIDRQLRALDRGVDVAVATPGRVIDLIDRGAFSGAAVEAVVVDEADRMADMGFLPQVDWILRRLDARKQTLLFSATLDGDVDVIIIATFVIRSATRSSTRSTRTPPSSIVSSPYTRWTVSRCSRRSAAVSIAPSCSCVPNAASIVWLASSRRKAWRAASMHGDLRQSARERSLRDFADGKLPVLIATDVAARGIHVDNVDIVVHFDPPEEPKAYTHRSGRTARAGQDGLVVTFVLWNQEREVEQLQKRLGLREPIIEVFSNDPRLADIASLTGPAPRRKAAVS